MKRIEEKTKKNDNESSHLHTARQSKQRPTKSRCTFVIFVCIWNRHGMGTLRIEPLLFVERSMLKSKFYEIPSIYCTGVRQSAPAQPTMLKHYSHVILLRIACLPFLIESNCRPYLPLQFIHKLTISLWTNVMIAPIDVVWKMTSSIRLLDE